MPDVVGGELVFPLPAPASDLVSDLWTYQDAVDLIVDVFQISQRSGQQLRAAMRAVDNALVRLPMQADWSYYSRRAMLRTEAAQTTGTVTYTHSSRQVTLAGATWPTTAAFGRVLIDDTSYPVESRLSGTVITLSAAENPGADVAAGAAYTWWRDEYVLPDDFLKVGTLFEQTGKFPLDYVNPNEWQDLSVAYNSTGTPQWYTVRHSSNYRGRRVLAIAPGPSAARGYEFAYQARPLPVRIRDYSSRTCSTSGTTVTFVANTVLPLTITGAIMRFSDNGNALPTSKFGRVNESGEEVVNLPYAEAIVAERLSDTTLSVDRTLPTLSAVRYTMSDPIDIDQSTMQDAFLALLEAEYARFTFKKPDERYGRLRESLQHIREAMGADYAYNGPSTAGGSSYRALRLSDFVDMVSS